MSGRAHHSSSNNSNKAQPRAPAAAATKSASARSADITCSVCGRLNFSHEATCESCRPAATSGSAGTSKSTAAAAPASSSSTSPRTTAILKAQQMPLPTRTGIIKGLRHGLPIDSYRKPNANSSQPRAALDNSQQTARRTVARANSLPVIAPDSRTAGSLQRSSSFAEAASSSQTMGSSQSNGSSSQQEPLATALRDRIQERQRTIASSATAAATVNSSSTAAGDEKSSLAALVGSNGGVPVSALITPTAPRMNKRPRSAQTREIIDLISSDEEEEDAEIAKRVDNGEGASKPQSETTTRPPTSSEPLARQAARVVQSSAAPAASEPRGSAPEITALSSQSSEPTLGYDGRLPFLSRCFPVIEFDPSDFAPGDAAHAARAARANRPSLAAAVGASSASSINQTSVPGVEAATSSIPVAQSNARPIPEQQRTDAPVRQQTPSVIAGRNPVPPTPPVIQPSVVASTVPSRRPSTLKRTASGVCEDQAIELGDDEDSQEQISTRDGLFQSRVFQSIEFNPRDFSTVQDGLHVARRSKATATQNDLPPRVGGPGADPAASGAELGTASRGQSVVAGDAPRVSGPLTQPSAPAKAPLPLVVTERSNAPTNVPLRVSTSVEQQPRLPTGNTSSKPSNQPSSASSSDPPRPVHIDNATVPLPRTPFEEAAVERPRTAASPSVPSDAQPIVSERLSAPVSLPTQAAASNVSRTAASKPVNAEGASGPKPSSQQTQGAWSIPFRSVSVPPHPAKSSDQTPKEPQVPAAQSPSTSSIAASQLPPSSTGSATTVSSSVPAPSTTTMQQLSDTTVSSAPALNGSKQPTMLQPRKKNTPVAVVSLSSEPQSMKKDVDTGAGKAAAKEKMQIHAIISVKKMAKPAALGDCNADFMIFMKDFVEGDEDEPMNDEDVTRQLQQQLLEMVDLTNLSDSDEDDHSSDGDDISEAPTPTALVLRNVQTHTTESLSSELLEPPHQVGNSPVPTQQLQGDATGPVGALKIDRRRIARQLEPCVLCEEKKWVKTLIHCKECKKYYHKKCAKEYGDEKICWNCELDGMIDDSELTETARDEVVDMLSTLRSSKRDTRKRKRSEATDGDANAPRDVEESKGEENDDSADESGSDIENEAGERANPLLTGAATKSMQRWKAFLDVSTSTVDKSFQEVTKRITEELLSNEQKSKYSRGFTTPESFQAAISEVLDNYAELQDQLDRESRDKPRGTTTAREDTAGTDSVASVSDAVAAGGISENDSAALTTTTLNLSSTAPTAPTATSAAAAEQSAEPTQIQREVVILDGV
uniref:Uncharacterized protein n=1 Tax=Globisporangium ultimum (strain ATCC 200006 / CBS 805.95 / DAOM BR144) TaxID=431595 RepID=K3X3D7_GLOUD